MTGTKLLIHKMKEVDENADRTAVVNSINNLRIQEGNSIEKIRGKCRWCVQSAIMV
jgi:hypothetical protein